MVRAGGRGLGDRARHDLRVAESHRPAVVVEPAVLHDQEQRELVALVVVRVHGGRRCDHDGVLDPVHALAIDHRVAAGTVDDQRHRDGVVTMRELRLARYERVHGQRQRGQAGALAVQRGAGERHRLARHRLLGRKTMDELDLPTDLRARVVDGFDGSLTRPGRLGSLERELGLVGDDPQQRVAATGAVSGRDATGQTEDVARLPGDGLRPPRRLATSGDDVVDLTGGLEARGQPLAGAQSRIASEDQRRGGGGIGAERRAEVERQQTGRCGRVEGAGALTGEHVRRNSRTLDVETVGRGIVAGSTRIRGLDGGGHGRLLGERGQRVTGEPAFSHAVMPPATLNHRARPWRFSALITVLERRPPAQRTALGRSAGTSPRRLIASSMGRWSAPSMWPSRHSTGSRTSMTATSRPSSSHSARSQTVICGTVSTGRPSLFHSIIPRSITPITWSTPTRASARNARSMSDGVCVSTIRGAPSGANQPTRSPNCGLSIQTLIAPGTWPSPYVAGSRKSSTQAPPALTASQVSRAV